MEGKQMAVVLNPKDNVATALVDLEAGAPVQLEVGQHSMKVTLTAPIPFGHKFSLTRIDPGAPVIKYGETIGTATRAINRGDYVHIHNVMSTRGRGDLSGGLK